jgi:Fur family ferric uptake transcriptional regulator
LILRSLFASPRHRTAEDLAAEVQAEAPDVHLSTVHRNLEELERLGVVTHVHLGDGPRPTTSHPRRTAISSARSVGR